jgi:hypothetical protein
MEFAQRVRDLAARSKHASEHALTEEATKTSVVMPLIQALGFDIFSLNEVIPEYVSDVGTKKGEKVDFALKINGEIAILVEVKPISMSLGNTQYSQLYRYFSVTAARLAILTNGREVWFFSDIDDKNKMDKRPFFVFDLQDFDDQQVKHLGRFRKEGFDVERVLEAASSLKYVKAAAQFFTAQVQSPTDEFVRYVGKHIYDGTLTKSVVEQLRPAIQSALEEVIRTRIQDRLNIAFTTDPKQKSGDGQIQGQVEIDGKDGIETTEEELQAFMIVRAIAAKEIEIERITMRDAKTYCSVFVDDNNRRPLCRFHFNGKKSKALSLFDPEKGETKVSIDKLREIYLYADQIMQTAAHYR